MKDFRQLQVWDVAHHFVLAVFKLTACFPPQQRYGLRTQIERAATSIAANIAEGCGHDSNAEFQRYLQIAAGSASEVEYELLLARDLGFIQETDHQRLDADLVRVEKILRSLIQKVSGDRHLAKAAAAAR